MSVEKFCEGCGIKLQTEDSKKIGYIPESSLKEEQSICQRCYRIKNYNEIMPSEIDENEFLQVLNNISLADCLVIHIADLFDFDGTLIHGIQRFIGKNPFIIAANKIDLFAKPINQARVKFWLSQHVKEQGLSPKEIFLISANKKDGLEEIIKYISEEHKNKDVYVVGATNVGKSTFINKLITILHGETRVELTTSKYPGTTLNIIKIPLTNKNYIIDTPGIIHHNRFSENVSPATLKEITPRTAIKPRVYQLKGNQTLYWGGLARIDQIGDTKNTFVCYLSNDLKIHRTKLSNAESMYEKHLGELLSPPTIDEAKTMPKQAKHSFNITGKSKVDIVISGLGWVTVDGDRTNVDVYVPKGIGVHIRKALI